MESLPNQLDSLKILLVDDEPPVRSIMALILRRAGHEVTEASDGQEGLEAFCQGEFNVVVTDNAMPRMTGIEMAARIRQMHPSQPVIMVTGHPVAGTPNVDLLLAKPVPRADLLAALQEIVSGAS